MERNGLLKLQFSQESGPELQSRQNYEFKIWGASKKFMRNLFMGKFSFHSELKAL